MAQFGLLCGVLHVTAISLLMAAPENGPVMMSCNFPKFVQIEDENEPSREWHTHIMKQNRESPHTYSMIVTFHDSLMKASIIGGQQLPSRPDPFTRECVEEMGPGKFLVSHQESGTSRELFLCMEFVKRSRDVVQLIESKTMNIPDYSLCDDRKLKINPWPLVNKVNAFKNHQTCQLSGGFSMKVFDKINQVGVCDAYHGETRLESECMKGEGIHFRFRDSQCVPKGLHMHKDQRTYCLATWEEKDYTFSVLRHDKTEHLWCLRYQTDYSKQFIGYLFKDVVCDSNAVPEHTINYLSLDITPDPPIGMQSLCMDDYEACEYWQKPCQLAGSNMQITCAKTCGICTETKPKVCRLPSELEGKWIDARTINDKDITKFNDTTVVLRNFDKFQCIQWELNPYGHNMRLMEQMFVTTFENGCRPRYTCMQIKKTSPSLLHYRLSQSQIWPFEKLFRGIVVDCSSFKFRDDDFPLYDRYRNKHSRVMVEAGERTYVDCKLGDKLNFEVSFNEGPSCSGSLTEEVSTNQQLKLSMDSCFGYQAEQNFACLDSERHGILSDRKIITESLDVTDDIRCWFFPLSPSEKFYLIEMKDCNDGASEKLEFGDLKPIATFTIQRKVLIDDDVIQVNIDDEDLDEDLSSSLPKLPKLPYANRGKVNKGPSYSEGNLDNIEILDYDYSPVRGAQKDVDKNNPSRQSYRQSGKGDESVEDYSYDYVAEYGGSDESRGKEVIDIKFDNIPDRSDGPNPAGAKSLGVKLKIHCMYIYGVISVMSLLFIFS